MFLLSTLSLFSSLFMKNIVHDGAIDIVVTVKVTVAVGIDIAATVVINLRIFVIAVNILFSAVDVVENDVAVILTKLFSYVFTLR